MPRAAYSPPVDEQRFDIDAALVLLALESADHAARGERTLADACELAYSRLRSEFYPAASL